jgi:hypothetical protein
MPEPDLNMWYEALGSERGVKVRTDDPKRCREKLYAFRREAKDPDLDALSVVQSPTSANEIWIIRRPEGSKDES